MKISTRAFRVCLVARHNPESLQCKKRRLDLTQIPRCQVFASPEVLNHLASRAEQPIHRKETAVRHVLWRTNAPKGRLSLMSSGRNVGRRIRRMAESRPLGVERQIFSLPSDGSG